MSYILDALKRADAERGTQQAPGALGGASEPSPHQRSSRIRPWHLGLAATVLAAVAVAGWLWPTVEDAEPVVAAAKPEISSPLIAAPDSTSQPLHRPAPAAMVQPVPPPPLPVDVAPAPPGEKAVMVTPSPGFLPLPPSLTEPTQTIDVMAAGPSTPPAIPAPQPNSPPPNILKRVPLPPAPPKVAVANNRPAAPTQATAPKAAPGIARAGQPEIAISGSSYSANPAHRMLIANGKVVKEGQELSPGLTLESIGQRTAVFNQGGARFNINY